MEENKSNRIIDYALLIGTFTLAFIYSLRRMSDSDLWGHLKCGEYLFKNGSILTTHRFNSSWPDFPYLNHEWLFQAIIYKTHAYAGEAGLITLQIILILLSFFILYKILRLYTDNIPLISFILSLGIIASSHRFALRPQHFSYVFLLYFLFSLHMYQQGKRKYTYLMPVIMTLWVNMHAESLWGIFIPMVFITSEYIKAYAKGMDKSHLKHMAIIFALTLIASMLNPFSYKTIIWPLFVMKEQFAGVEELLPPITSRYLFFWLYFSVFVLLSVLNKKRPEPVWLLLSIFYAAVAWTANRGIPHFVFVSAPVIAIGFERVFKNRMRFIARYSILTRFMLWGLLSYTIFTIASSPLYFKKYDNIPYPEDALRFLKANNVSGNILNHHPWGGFIIWNSYPDLKPYIDGRFFHKKFYDEFYHILSGGTGWQNILSKYDITIALFPYSTTDNMTLNDRLFREWQLVYWDDVSLLYLRKTETNKNIIRKFGNEIINPDRQLYEYNEKLPDLIKTANIAAEQNLIFAPQSYKALILSANTYFIRGDYEMAVKRFEESLRYATGGNAWIYYRLALSYRHLGDLKKTEEYIKKCLSLAPDFEEGKRLLNEARFFQQK